MRKIEVDVVTHIMSKCKPVGKCFIWQGSKPKGYGVLMIPGTRKMALAHKVVFEAVHGPVPAGFLIMHSCDQPDCCNINHLSLGTHKRNVNDSSEKGRRLGGNAKLSEVDRIKIKELSAILTDFDISKLYGCSAAAIQRARLDITKPRDPATISAKAAKTRRKNLRAAKKKR